MGTNPCSRHNHCFLKWHCVAGKTFFYCYTGDTLFIEANFHFQSKQLDQTCPRKTYPSFPGAFARPTFKVAFADEPRKSFHSEVPGLQATQCKPGKPAPPHYSVRQSTDLLIGKTLSAPRVI